MMNLCVLPVVQIHGVDLMSSAHGLRERVFRKDPATCLPRQQGDRRTAMLRREETKSFGEKVDALRAPHGNIGQFSMEASRAPHEAPATLRQKAGRNVYAAFAV
jgi:hypothetical protein